MGVTDNEDESNVTVNEANVTVDFFDNMVSIITEKFQSFMIVRKGVKDRNVKDLDIYGVITTLFAPGHLSRDEDYMNGYMLSDYRLDPRLESLVMPRGIYIDESKLALNWLVPYPIDKTRILKPSIFIAEQAKIFGAMRLSDNLTTTLAEKSESMTLSSAAKRFEDNGFVHDDSEYYIPLRVSEACYTTQHYNLEVEDMIELKMVKIFGELK